MPFLLVVPQSEQPALEDLLEQFSVDYSQPPSGAGVCLDYYEDVYVVTAELERMNISYEVF